MVAQGANVKMRLPKSTLEPELSVFTPTLHKPPFLRRAPPEETENPGRLPWKLVIAPELLRAVRPTCSNLGLK